jgi:hypothetical protein
MRVTSALRKVSTCPVTTGLLCAAASCSRSRSASEETPRDLRPEAPGHIAQAGLLLSTVDDIRNEMEAVFKIDEGYQNGSAHMVRGVSSRASETICGT